MKKLSLLEVLEGLEDNRRELSVWYPPHEVLFILLTAVICGATSYAKVETFSHLREKWLTSLTDAHMFADAVRSIGASKTGFTGSWT